MLEAAYPADALPLEAPFGTARDGFWGYASRLPVPDAASRLTLGEGNTPLVRSRRIGMSLGLPELMLDQWIARANGNEVREDAPAGAQVTTILIVDDQPEVGSLAEDILEPEGYAVMHTTDPMEAIRVARTRPGDIDVLLVDIVMPLMDGRELAQRILALRPKVRVILMSGYEVSGIKGAGFAFLQKPFGIETLRRIVADTLRQDPSKRARGPFAPPS